MNEIEDVKLDDKIELIEEIEQDEIDPEDNPTPKRKFRKFDTTDLLLVLILVCGFAVLILMKGG